MTKSIEFRGIKFSTAGEAIQWTEADGRGKAVRIEGGYYVIEQAEADRLGALDVEFAYLADHVMPDGSYRIITIPVND
jgi:hypothetical protein